MFRSQWKLITKKKSVQVAFVISIVYALVSFFMVRGELSNGFSGFWSYCGMEFNTQWDVYSIIICFLVAIPAMSFQDDVLNQTVATVWIRSSRKEYLKAKIGVVFLADFLLVLIPCLVNFSLCLFYSGCYGLIPSPFGHTLSTIKFNLLNVSPTDWFVGTYVPFPFLFEHCPILYVLLYMIFMAAFVGFLGVVLLAISFWIRRFKIVLFIPVFIATKIGTMLDGWSYNTNYMRYNHRYVNFDMWDYVAPASYYGLNYLAFFGIILLLCGFIYISYRMLCGKEYVDV